MGGGGLLQLLSLLPRVGLLIAPVGAAVMAYVVCQVLRTPSDKTLLYTGIVFVVALLIVIAIMIARRVQRKRSDDKLADGLAGAGDSRGEVEALRRQWKESLAKLKDSAVGGGGTRALAALPWFVIIGAPASGKSTLLRQSGIDFPIGDAAIRGLQGTRNCDWWFSSVGVFLDTAGRYISDAGAAEWAQFLDLVRKHRSGSPIHGVIVALPAPDLVERGMDQVVLDARRIRARLDELIDHLGVNFPVWVVLTKVDLLGGFVELFGNADAGTRAQIMGWTAEQAEGARLDVAVCAQRFEALTHRLREMRPALLARCQLRDRPAAFAFPDEFAALGEPLGVALRTIFEPNVYQETPLFRGLYVTSATQQGTPLQRAAARIRDLLGAPHVDDDAGHATVRHAYFVKDLMHERIVRDQSMTWTTQTERDRGRNKRVGITLMGASVGVLLFLTVVAFGLKASAELGVVEENVAAVSRERRGGVERTVSLREAARLTAADNLENLGLSQQRSLRQDLVRAEETIYREDVVTPLLTGWARDVSEAPVDRGPSELVALYEDFLAVESLLDRAVTQAPPEGAEEPAGDGDAVGDGDGDGAAPDGNDAEEGGPAPLPAHFTDREVDVLVRRADRLRAWGVVGHSEARAAARSLLDTVWENHGAAAWMEDVAFAGDEVAHSTPDKARAWEQELARAVHDAFRGRIASYCRVAGESVGRLERDRAATAAYVEARLTAFRAEAERVRVLLTSSDLERVDLNDALTDLADAAAGRDRNAPDAAAGDAAADAALVGSIGGALELLDSGRLRTLDASFLEGVDGLAAMRRWAAAGENGADGASSGPDALAPLEVIARALERERRRLTEGRVVPRPWPAERAATIGEALDSIDAFVADRARAWQIEVRPQLAALAGATDIEEYATDERRLGLGVERLVPAIARDEMLATFLGSERRGSFARLARQSVVRGRERDGSTTRATLSMDLEELLAPIARADEDDLGVIVTVESRSEAERLAEKTFEQLVAIGTDVWESRCRAIPQYRGAAPWDYLAQWVESGSDVGRLASDLERALGDGAPDSGLRDSPASEAALRIWKKTEPLMTRFGRFPDIVESLRAGLSKLYARRDLAPAPGMAGPLADLARDLGLPDTRPAWDPDRLFAATGASTAALDDGTRRSLRAALGDAEDDLVRRLERYFNGRWERARRDIERAITDADADALDAARDELEADLSPFFGADLAQRPGRRLALTPEFSAVWMDLAAGHAVPRTLGLELRCTLLPVAGGDEVRLPFLELEYLERGDSEPRRMLWEPNRPRPWTVDCEPGQGVKLTIWMVSEDRAKREEFRHWSGPDALLEAVRDGGGGGELVWDGRGRYAESKAHFQLSATDPAALRALLAPSGPELTTRLRGARCVEVLRRP